MDSKGRYLSGQKISDVAIERILFGYAKGLTAAEFVRQAKLAMRTPPASKTVYRLYRLVRKRLVEIGSYPQADLWIEVAETEGSPINLFYMSRGLEKKIEAEMARRRGLTAANWDEMVGEFISRVAYPHASPANFLAHIKRAIRMTGRLNEPAKNLAIWSSELDVRGAQFYIDYVRETLRKDSASLEPLVSHYELEIDYYRRKQRREIRRVKKP